MTTPRVIVDAHRHIECPQDGLFRGLERILADMDANNVAVSVIVPAARQIAVDNREGNDAVLTGARAFPGRLLPMCTVNPWYGSRAVEELRRTAVEGAVGLKLHPALQGFCLSDPLVHPVVDEAALLGLPIYVHTGTPPYAQPLQLAELARTVKEATFILGHAGATDLKADADAAVELAGNIVMETSWMLPLRLREVVGSVGADRVMFGSDAPFSSLAVEVSNHRAAQLPAEAMEAVMGATVQRVLGVRAWQ